jgi:copper chaperone CopZ
VLTAVLASACCWLPLAAVLAGVSAAGAAAFLWSARPWLLSGSAVLLGAGLWISYRRRPRCGPGDECASPPGARRGGRPWLWTATALLAVSAFFPQVLGLREPGPAAAAPGSRRIDLPIEGMTCAGCERAVEASLRKVEGVADARASSDEARAIVTVDATSSPPRAALIAAVAAAGFRVADRPDPAGHWVGTLGEGEDAAELIADIGPAGEAHWIGEADFPSQGLENVALRISVEGRDVRLVVPLPDEVAFAGELSAGGDSLTGRFTQGETDIPFVLVRSGEAVISEELLAMEAPVDDAAVTILSDGWPELKREFNAAADRTRLLLLLSPT